jgi:SAM-dependent methyltransferase
MMEMSAPPQAAVSACREDRMALTQPTYLDLQARIGITKHNGGFPATDRLIELCHVGRHSEVLYVGSGIGVGPAHLARRHGCRVTAVDISPTMLEWTQRRVRRDGVADLVDTQVADVTALPFPDGCFDVVVVESVLAFVEDKTRALAECARVTRRNGWVGMNETVWLAEAPTGELAVDADALGTWLVTQGQWRALWQDGPLVNQMHELHPLSMREEVRSRVAWIGWRWLLPAWGRALRIALSDPEARAALREQLGYPTALVDLMGYVLSTGRRA